MPVTFEICVILFLILLNGCFSLSELAIVSSRRARLSAKAAQGSKGARVALELAENPARFLSSVQIGITLVGILTGAFSGATLAQHVAAWLAETAPALGEAGEALSMLLVVGAITYASVVVGELVPKQIALASPETIAILAARPMAGLASLLSPLVWILETSSRALLAVLRVRPSTEQAVTQEEVKAMIAEGTETGVFEPQEKEMIAGVMRFGGRKIRNLMTPRSDVTAIDAGWDKRRVTETLLACSHSRIPVYMNSPDEIMGVVQAKDLLNALLQNKPLDLEPLLRKVEVVHDNAPALLVLDVLKQSPVHLALVVDEYGGFEGIVTMADILSSIVGSLHEHGEEYEPSVVEREDGSWLIDGDMPLDLASERTGCPLLSHTDGDYSTVAGFALSQLRRIPKAGEHFEIEGWRFEIVDMDGRRIDKVLLARKIP